MFEHDIAVSYIERDRYISMNIVIPIILFFRNVDFNSLYFKVKIFISRRGLVGILMSVILPKYLVYGRELKKLKVNLC